MGTNSIYIPSMCDGYEWALPRSEADMEQIGLLDGNSRKADWRSIPVKFVRAIDDEALIEADFPWFGGDHALALRPHAVEALSDLLNAAGEVLPLACEETELFLWNVTTVIDALDPSSRLARIPKSNQVMAIVEHVFNADKLGEAIAFRIPEWRTIYLSTRFVARVAECGLTGLNFVNVWP